jgi:hypothetical protein
MKKEEGLGRRQTAKCGAKRQARTCPRTTPQQRDGKWAGRMENGEAVKYKGTSAVKRVINPQRFTSLKAGQKAEASEPECIPKILKTSSKQYLNRKKEKYPSDRWYGLASIE